MPGFHAPKPLSVFAPVSVIAASPAQVRPAHVPLKPPAALRFAFESVTVAPSAIEILAAAASVLWITVPSSAVTSAPAVSVERSPSHGLIVRILLLAVSLDV